MKILNKVYNTFIVLFILFIERLKLFSCYSARTASWVQQLVKGFRFFAPTFHFVLAFNLRPHNVSFQLISSSQTKDQ